MASTLISNLSSDLIKAANNLAPKNAPKNILVYVEGYADISFWKSILVHYENDMLRFAIQTPTKKGKQGLLGKSNEMLQLIPGEYMILCVDSDYDYLLQGITAQSKNIIENPFIFHTYSYSIENLLCFSESLHHICVQATMHDKKLIDLVAFLELYSEIIYPLFLWNVYFHKNMDTKTFTISAFSQIVKLAEPIDIDNNCQNTLALLSDRVNEKLLFLHENFSGAKNNIGIVSNELSNIGIDTKNVYLFVQGHMLKDSVVLVALKAICVRLRNEKFEQIKWNPKDAQREHKEYKNLSTLNVEPFLNSNTEFKKCFLFEKIKVNFDRYVLGISN